MSVTRVNVTDDLDRRWRMIPTGAGQWAAECLHPSAGMWEPSATRPTLADCLAYIEEQQSDGDASPTTVDGKALVRVVIDVLADPTADADTLALVGEVLAERMSDNLHAVLGVNPLMAEHDVTAWWVRYEPTSAPI